MFAESFDSPSNLISEQLWSQVKNVLVGEAMQSDLMACFCEIAELACTSWDQLADDKKSGSSLPFGQHCEKWLDRLVEPGRSRRNRVVLKVHCDDKATVRFAVGPSPTMFP